MPDGTGTEATGDQPPNADQQIDGQVAVINLLDNLPFFGNAARDAYASGGGGAGGTFQIASLAELDGLINQWQSLVDRMDESRQRLEQAVRHVQAPAQDTPSQTEAMATKDSINAAIDHNMIMREYAQGYVEKLQAARADYAGTESDNTSLVGHSDGD